MYPWISHWWPGLLKRIFHLREVQQEPSKKKEGTEWLSMQKCWVPGKLIRGESIALNQVEDLISNYKDGYETAKRQNKAHVANHRRLHFSFWFLLSFLISISLIVLYLKKERSLRVWKVIFHYSLHPKIVIKMQTIFYYFHLFVLFFPTETFSV